MRKMYVAIVALAVVVGGLQTAAPAAQAAFDSGIKATCNSTPSGTCTEDAGNCKLTVEAPDIVPDRQDSTNLEVRQRSNIECDNGKDRLKLGAQRLFRYDCDWYTPLQNWICDNETQVGGDHNAYCGYAPTFPNKGSCFVVGTSDGFGYAFVSDNWRYDFKDTATQCHGWQLQVIGASWKKDAVTGLFATTKAYGKLWGPVSHGMPCRGLVGQH